GGSNLTNLVAPFNTPPQNRPHAILQHVDVQSLLLPADVKAESSGHGNVLVDYANLLLVSYGLSFHRAESPDLFLPVEVPPLPVQGKRGQEQWDSDPLS